MVRDGDADWRSPAAARLPLTSACSRPGRRCAWSSPDTCRPFSRDRTAWSSARAARCWYWNRSTPPQRAAPRSIAEIVGFGMSADASISRSLRRAGRPAPCAPPSATPASPPSRSATSTPTAPAHRSQRPHRNPAIRASLRPPRRQARRQLHQVLHGHTLGAAGASRPRHRPRARARHPSAHRQLPQPRPRVRPRHRPQPARPHRSNACLSNSFAFGGLNAVLALRKFA